MQLKLFNITSKIFHYLFLQIRDHCSCEEPGTVVKISPFRPRTFRLSEIAIRRWRLVLVSGRKMRATAVSPFTSISKTQNAYCMLAGATDSDLTRLVTQSPWLVTKMTTLFWSQTGTLKLICQSALFGLKFSLYSEGRGQKSDNFASPYAERGIIAPAITIRTASVNSAITKTFIVMKFLLHSELDGQ